MAYYVTEERNDALEHAGFKYIKKLPIGGGRFRYIYDKDYGKGYDKKFGGPGKYGVYRKDNGKTRETLSVEKGKGLFGTRTVKKNGNQRMVTVRTGKIEQGIDNAKSAISTTGRRIKRAATKKFEDATGITAKKQYQKAKQARANSERDIQANKSKRKQLENNKVGLEVDRTFSKMNAANAKNDNKSYQKRYEKKNKLSQFLNRKTKEAYETNAKNAARADLNIRTKQNKNETDLRKANKEYGTLLSKNRNAKADERRAKDAYENSIVGKIDKYRNANPSVKELLNDTERVTSKHTVLRTSDKQLGEKTKWSNESGTAHKRLKDTINKGEASAKSSNKEAKKNASKAAKAFTNKNYEDGLKYVAKAVKSKANAAGASASTALNKAKYNTTVKERETERYGVVHNPKKRKSRK